MIECKQCGKYRRARVFILFPEGNYTREVMYRAFCGKCNKHIVFLWSYKDNGEVIKRQISLVKKFLDRRVILCEEKPVNRNWKKAKGYRYFKGFKKGDRGGILKFSDDSREEMFFE